MWRELFGALAGLRTVNFKDEAIVATALALSEQGMDFADALHLGKSAICAGFATSDRKLVTAARAAGYEGVRKA